MERAVHQFSPAHNDADAPRVPSPGALGEVREVTPASVAPSGSPVIRVAIAEPDDASRYRIIRLIESVAGLEIVGSVRAAHDAIALSIAVAPDVMFVAHDPPAVNGIAAIRALPRTPPPATIVVGDREDHAYWALESGAADYVLRRASAERFERAIARARRFVDDQETHRLVACAAALRPPAAAKPRLIVKAGRHLLFVAFDEIDWIESERNYVRLHAAGQVYTARESLKNLEGRLDGRFIRVNRSAVINSERIRSVIAEPKEECHVVLKDGTRVPAGRYLEWHLRRWMNDAL